MKRRRYRPTERPKSKRLKVKTSKVMDSSSDKLVDLYNPYETINGCWKDVSGLFMDYLSVRDASRLGATCKSFKQTYAQWYERNVVMLQCYDTKTILESTGRQIMDIAGTERMNFVLLLLNNETKKCASMVRVQLTGVVYRNDETLLSCRMFNIYGKIDYAFASDVCYASAEDYSEAIKQHLTLRYIKKSENLTCHLVKIKKRVDINPPFVFVQKFKKYAIANTEHYLLNCVHMPIRVVPVE